MTAARGRLSIELLDRCSVGMTVLAYLIYLTIARITLEVLMVIFGIGEDVREMREAAVGKGSTSSEA